MWITEPELPGSVILCHVPPEGAPLSGCFFVPAVALAFSPAYVYNESRSAEKEEHNERLGNT